MSEPSLLDRGGMLAGSLCLTHAVIQATLPSALPSLGLTSLQNPEVEWGFTVAAMLLALSAAWIGWRKHHAVHALGWLGGGAASLLFGRLAEGMGAGRMSLVLAVAGGSMLMLGHLLNIRFTSANEAHQ